MTATLMMAVLAGPPAHALDASAVNPLISEFNAGSDLDIPTLSASDSADLASGEVVRVLRKTTGDSYQVVGLLLVPLPRKQVWIAGQDPHFASGAATEKQLRTSGDQATWYGFLDLPMGFSDRHWVVDVWNNHALAAQTDNRMWEHPWRLRDGGLSMARPFVERGEVGDLTVEQFDKAIFTPDNEGALAFLAVSPDETLLIYHATTSVGGSVPERLMAEFARSTLHSLLTTIADNARDVVPTHYGAAHPRLYGGDGELLPQY